MFIDDMIIYSMTWDEHIDRIKVVLDVLIKMGMKISLKKFQSCFEELKAL